MSYGLAGVHTCQHAKELLIRNEEVTRKGSSFFLKVFIQPLLDLLDSDVDLGNLLNHAPTAVHSSGLISDFFIEQHGIGSDILQYLLPLRLPAEELLALLGQQF